MARLALFNMPFDEFKAKTMEYIDKYGDKEEYRPSWSHYASYIGGTPKLFEDICEAGKEVGSTYYNYSQLLIKMSTWIRGQIEASPGWAKAPAAIRILLLKQPYCDNNAYVDGFNRPDDDKKIEVNIKFGDGSKRAQSALK